MILRQSGRESQAVNMARNGLELLAKQGSEEPENVNLALVRAQFSIFLKQYENAITILNKTAKLSDDKRLVSGSAEILVLWSRDQSMIANPTERFARQLTLLSKAVEIAPNHPLVVNDLMTVTLQCTDAKDPKVAELRYLLVQGIAPELSHFIRGTAAMMRDDLDEATLHLELAAKGLPTVPAVLNNLAVALATKEDADLDRALQMVDAAIKQVPNQPYFYETRGQILLKQGDYTNAIQSFERALPAKALGEQIHDGLGKAYLALGQNDIAQQHQKLADAIREAKKVEEVKGDVEVDFSKKKQLGAEVVPAAEATAGES
jgi:tetratricopeptide (TPR) repeat protein